MTQTKIIRKTKRNKSIIVKKGQVIRFRLPEGRIAHVANYSFGEVEIYSPSGFLNLFIDKE